MAFFRGQNFAIFFRSDRLIGSVWNDTQEPETDKRYARGPASQQQQKVARITREQEASDQGEEEGTEAKGSKREGCRSASVVWPGWWVNGTALGIYSQGSLKNTNQFSAEVLIAAANAVHPPKPVRNEYRHIRATEPEPLLYAWYNGK